MSIFDVLVIGAGWSGLTAAQALSAKGLKLAVLEKGRGPGGRCATRRQGGFSFDHGTQYFTARSADFSRQVDAWIEDGLVEAWTPRIRTFGQRPADTGSSPDRRLVAAPGMNSVLSSLASTLDCRFAQRIVSMRHEGHWTVDLDSGEQLQARAMVLTAPPAQAADLLGAEHPLSQRLRQVPMEPTWALMVGFDALPDPGFDAAFDNDGPLAWLAANSSKPGRSACAWVAHADLAWSRAHLEDDRDLVAEQLLEALALRLDLGRLRPQFCTAHRWRYAQSSAPLDVGCLWQPDQRLALAGDWCAGNRVEGAWSSGRQAAEQLSAVL